MKKIKTKRAKFASKAVALLVKARGGNHVCQKSAQTVTRIKVLDGETAALAISDGYKTAMRIKNNRLLKHQAL